MPWSKYRLRDAEVWAKVDSGGQLVTDRDGRVEIVYKPVTGARVYRASEDLCRVFLCAGALRKGSPPPV